jgi:GNAT superfamily N-acetyltransferase
MGQWQGGVRKSEVKLRLLQPSDMPDLMALKAAAGWNQTEADCARFLRYQPDGCFGMEDSGRVVASSTCMCYGDEMAWIGMVLTLPEYRGRGLGRKLTRVAVDHAGHRIVRLDASDLGRPLYESMGFIEECKVERWRREPGRIDGQRPELEPVRWDPVLDTEVFGADRTRLLNELAKHDAASYRSGYAFARDGSNGPFFGPCVATNLADADQLFSWFIRLHGSVRPTYTDLFPVNRNARELAAKHGFTLSRSLTRMVLQPATPRVPDARIYAISCFAWG